MRQGAGDRAFAWHMLPLSPTRRVVFVDAPESFDRAGVYGEAGPLSYRAYLVNGLNAASSVANAAAASSLMGYQSA